MFERLFRDLFSKRALILKGLLFGVLGVLAMVANLLAEGFWLRLLSAGIGIWAFCRWYYFLFYVLQHYVDPSLKYDGLLAQLRQILRRRF